MAMHPLIHIQIRRVIAFPLHDIFIQWGRGSVTYGDVPTHSYLNKACHSFVFFMTRECGVSYNSFIDDVSQSWNMWC